MITTNPYELRSKTPFEANNVHSVFNGTETITFRVPKIWPLVSDEIKKSQSLSEFNWKPGGCVADYIKDIMSLGFDT